MPNSVGRTLYEISSIRPAAGENSLLFEEEKSSSD